MLPFPINANRTDAKSPIDQDLMDDLRLNQEFLDDQLGAGGGGTVFEFKVSGLLNALNLSSDIKNGRRLDSAFVPSSFTPTRARMYLEKGAKTGKLKVDAHYNVDLNHPIISIDEQMELLTQDIGRAGAGFSTQAIAFATPTISVQAINEFHANQNIESISLLEDGNVLVTFEGAVLLPEDEYLVGDRFVISGATAGANDGNFIILGVNFDGLPSILYSNGSAVNQEGQVGTGRLFTFEIVFLAAVNDNFADGETVSLAGLDAGANNGNIPIFRINQSGNNIITKPTNTSSVTQAGVNGTAETNRMEYTFLGAVDNDFLVGEIVEFTGHTSGNNNGDFEILRKNNPANTVVIFNDSGVVQAGVAGLMDSNHWIYAMPSDPSDDINVGETGEFVNHTSSLNDGVFTILEINKNAVDNLVIYNPVGTDQGGVAGSALHTRKIVTFLDDKEAFYTVDKSFASIEGLVVANDDDEYLVKETNRGTILDFNIVVEAPGLTKQLLRVGRVAFEKRSLFDVLPVIEFTQEKIRDLQADITNTLLGEVIPSNARLTMDILEVPDDFLAETMSLTIE